MATETSFKVIRGIFRLALVALMAFALAAQPSAGFGHDEPGDAPGPVGTEPTIQEIVAELVAVAPSDLAVPVADLEEMLSNLTDELSVNPDAKPEDVLSSDELSLWKDFFVVVETEVEITDVVRVGDEGDNPGGNFGVLTANGCYEVTGSHIGTTTVGITKWWYRQRIRTCFSDNRVTSGTLVNTWPENLLLGWSYEDRQWWNQRFGAITHKVFSQGKFELRVAGTLVNQDLPCVEVGQQAISGPGRHTFKSNNCS